MLYKEITKNGKTGALDYSQKLLVACNSFGSRIKTTILIISRLFKMHKTLFFTVLFAFMAGCGGGSSGGGSDVIDPGPNPPVTLTGVSISEVGGDSSTECGKVSYKLVGHYSDNSSKDLDLYVTWKSSDNKIASFTDPNNAKGELLLKSEGEVTITGTYSFGGIVKPSSETLNIDFDVTVESLELSASDNYPACKPLNPKAMASYGTGKTDVDVSRCVTWKSVDSDDDDSDADVNVYPDGRYMAMRSGVTASIEASLASGTSATLPVVFTDSMNEYKMTAIVSRFGGDSEESVTVAPGRLAYIKVEATYDNESTANITRYVDWENASSDQYIAKTFNDFQQRGKVEGVAKGTATITTSCDGRSDSIAVIVDPTKPLLGMTATDVEFILRKLGIIQ